MTDEELAEEFSRPSKTSKPVSPKRGRESPHGTLKDTETTPEHNSVPPQTQKKKPPPYVLDQSLKDVLLPSGHSVFEAVLAVAQSLVRGLPFTIACCHAGYPPNLIQDLMRKHPSVAAALNYAWADAIANCVDILKRAAEKDWRSIAFSLERSYPSLYAEVKSISRKDLHPMLTSCSGEAKTIEVSKLTDEELMALVD